MNDIYVISILHTRLKQRVWDSTTAQGCSCDFDTTYDECCRLTNRSSYAVYLYYVESKMDIKINQDLVSAIIRSYGFYLNSKVLF